MKILLYCCKNKPYLYYNWNKDVYNTTDSLDDLKNGWSRCICGENRIRAYQENYGIMTNGHILAECDYEVEERLNYGLARKSELMLKGTCLTMNELNSYLKTHKEYDENDVFYAIHIKNLHIFDKPKELSDYYHNASKLEKAPQNMMMVQELIKSSYKGSYLVKDYVLISVRPEWLCKILNGEKTIEIRKKVLKEML